MDALVRTAGRHLRAVQALALQHDLIRYARSIARARAAAAAGHRHSGEQDQQEPTTHGVHPVDPAAARTSVPVLNTPEYGTGVGGRAWPKVEGPALGGRSQPMPEIVPPSVRVIAWTQFETPDGVPWSTDAGYLRHILDVGHLSVLEHGVVTFYMTGVSRSFTHELIRHRHFSYSQLSQRYVPERQAAMVEPEAIAEDPELHKKFIEATEASVRAYIELLEGLESRFADVDNATLRRKQARQAARSVLPNATETRIVVTGNYRAWRHFIAMRATEHADVEIREIAIACLRKLQRVAPNVFGDFTISTLPDGSEIAASPFTWES